MSIATLIITIAIVFISFKYILPIAKIIIDGDIKLNKNSKISNDEYKKLSVGALYASQQNAYQNSLETGIGRKIKIITQKWWGIDNSKNAQTTIENLLHNGSKTHFPLILEALKAPTHEEKEAIILNNIKDEETVVSIMAQLYNLHDCYTELKEDNVISNKEDLAKFGSSAWDYGRAAFLSRVCFDAGYLSKDEAWQYINQAYELAKKDFKNWEDFARSYIIGRSMWSGSNSTNSGTVSMAESLLKENKSPWIKFPL